ncbi:MAG: uroporphyrinogen-III synthase [Chlamydiae bacterium]|nr:uroporphyrinogen-III synthase [Chlamydiota bacterium]
MFISKDKKSVLYLGLNPSHYPQERPILHCPVIKIVPRSKESLEIKEVFAKIEEYSHIIFTSKNGVEIFFEYLEAFGLDREKLRQTVIIAVGHVTALYLEKEGMSANFVAGNECQEGIIDILSEMDLDGANMLLPRSSIARPLLSEYLVEQQIKHKICSLYDTISHKPETLPDLEDVGEIVFTSPSTVDAFFEIFERVPSEVHLTALGPITRKALREKMQQVYDAVAVC